MKAGFVIVSDSEMEVPDEPGCEVESVTLAARGVVWSAVSLAHHLRSQLLTKMVWYPEQVAQP